MAKETEQKKPDLATEIGSRLHDDWRKNYAANPENVNEDGSVKPRWKEIKDEGFNKHLDTLREYRFMNRGGTEMPSNYRETPDGWEVDIAHSDFGKLSPDWQFENLEAGKVISDLIKRKDNGENISMEEAGHIIHEEWLKRNQWAKDDPKLGVPFAQLFPDEQEKDLAQLKLGREIQKDMAKEGKGFIGRLLVDAGLSK